ncbi:hypothetical protein CKM354_000403100 [Cercospora kikuchii]|uniref:SnoaL-like domain-containing protein n=1 Tax=Cercospora kikuchii TaxID=84275 RepID=A0A9P3CDC0_9PEZI|nr:uncharacterized protein CKM354_000403100 [Cercospora kikuchii]GIZ40703.1 hypothetical protein CKM354_000403100 [Cercospora kikuchii]
MSYTIENVEWMNVVSQDVKKLIQAFFSIADKPDPEAGQLWIDQVFSETGKLVVGEIVIEGAESIRNARKNAWNAIKARKHVVQRVYAGGSAGQDIMLHGIASSTIAANDETVDIPFAARFLLDQKTLQGFSPRALLYQVWADQSRLTEALKKSS